MSGVAGCVGPARSTGRTWDWKFLVDQQCPLQKNMRTILLLLLAVTAYALDQAALIKHLKPEEGFRSKPYVCTMGYWTIGYGHRCKKSAPAVSRSEAEQVLLRDVEKAIEQARDLIGDNHPESVEFIVVAMVFQMGQGGVADFKNTLRNIKAGNYLAASKNMLRSDWRKQTPDRCERLSAMMASVTN